MQIFSLKEDETLKNYLLFILGSNLFIENANNIFTCL